MNEQDPQLNILFQKAKNVSLFTEEKEDIHQSLAAFMESNPVGEKTKIATAQPSPLVMNPGSTRLYKANGNVLFALFSNQKQTNMIIALLLAFGLTAGTSFAAQNALPGDALYPVKIHLNEEVESIVAVGAKADAEVKAKHALTRLEEAEQLKAEGRLTTANKGEVESQFRENVKAINKDLGELHSQGDIKTEAKVRGQFNQNAEAHRKSLLVVHADGTADTEHSVDLGNLLGEDSQSEADVNREGKTYASSTIGESATTSLRIKDREGGQNEVDNKEGKTDVKDESEIKTHTDDELQVKTGVTGGLQPTISL